MGRTALVVARSDDWNLAGNRIYLVLDIREMNRATAHSNRITPRQLKALQTMWPRVAPMLKGDREARLAYAAGIVGREIHSYNDLTVDEAARVIDTMQREIQRSSSTSPSWVDPRRSHGVVHFPYPLQPSTTTERTAPEVFPETSDLRPQPPAQAEIRHTATDRQLWYLKKIANYMNWDNAHLDNFLEKKFHCRKLWALTTQQANGAIRLLLEFAARRDIKLRLGKDHPVSKTEINAEIPKVKAKLLPAKHAE